jgi:hypothetical protein
MVQETHFTIDLNPEILLEEMLCPTENEMCALIQSESCPGSDASCNFQFWDKITYRQWVTTDCSI